MKTDSKKKIPNLFFSAQNLDFGQKNQDLSILLGEIPEMKTLWLGIFYSLPGNEN